MASSTPIYKQVVIIGAGVVGLTIAHVLSTRYRGLKITIVARDMPEDLDSQGFSSPWAGANWSPFGYNEKIYKRELFTFNKFWDMQPTNVVHVVPSKIYVPNDREHYDYYFKDLVRNFRYLPSEELPDGMREGVVYDTIAVNPEEYLGWLKAQLVSFGVAFTRTKLQGLNEAARVVGGNGVIFNASGLGKCAKSLIGVEDQKVFPTRGQTILVHAPEVRECMAVLPSGSTPEGEGTYAIPRPSPHGHVLLGGTYQDGNWDTSVDFATAQRIWETCTKYIPELKTEKTKVVGHNVGLRPAREGGPRVELEWTEFPAEREHIHGKLAVEDMSKLPVVHTYGFGGTGYQNSWGAAEEAIGFVKDLLNWE